MKSVLIIPSVAAIYVAVSMANAHAIDFPTEADFTNNFIQTAGASEISWNSGGFIMAPAGLTSLLYSVGGDPERSGYSDAHFLNEAVSVTFTLKNLNGSLSIYSRVNETTHSGVAGYFGIVNGSGGTQVRFRLYNATNPDTNGVSNQVGSDVLISLQSGIAPISTSDVLTLTFAPTAQNNQAYGLTLERGGQALAYFERALATPVTGAGSVGIRAFEEMHIYSFRAIPEAPTASMALVGGALLLAFGSKRIRRSR